MNTKKETAIMLLLKYALYFQFFFSYACTSGPQDVIREPLGVPDIFSGLQNQNYFQSNILFHFYSHSIMST
jgi:hypothetical protein